MIADCSYIPVVFRNCYFSSVPSSISDCFVLPKEPKSLSLVVRGLHVNRGESGRNHVALTEVGRAVAGSYMCKVTATEAPSAVRFVAAVRTMTVVDREGNVHGRASERNGHLLGTALLVASNAVVVLLM